MDTNTASQRRTWSFVVYAAIIGMAYSGIAAERPVRLINKVRDARDSERAQLVAELRELLLERCTPRDLAALVEALQTDDRFVLDDLTGVLKDLSSRQPAAFEGSVGQLGATLPKLRARSQYNVIYALGTLGRFAGEANSALRALGADGVPKVSAWALAASARVDPDDQESLNRLLELCTVGQHDDRLVALHALLFSAADGERVASAYRAALKDPSPGIRTLAAKGAWLTDAKPAEVVPVLRQLLREPPDTICTWPAEKSEYVPSHWTLAATLLAKMRSAAQDSVAELEHVVKVGDSFERLAAITALGSIGPAASDAEPVLRELLTDPVTEIRDAVQRALLKISKSAD